MISNERPSPYGQRPYGGYPQRPKRSVEEESLKTEKIQDERKTFIFTLKENPRGRFLRITEDVNGRRDTIIVPSTGLEEFRDVLERMTRTEAEIEEEQDSPGEADNEADAENETESGE